MRLSDEDKILMKNLHDSKGYRGYSAKESNERVGWKRLEQKWTVMQRRV